MKSVRFLVAACGLCSCAPDETALRIDAEVIPHAQGAALLDERERAPQPFVALEPIGLSTDERGEVTVAGAAGVRVLARRADVDVEVRVGREADAAVHAIEIESEDVDANDGVSVVTLGVSEGAGAWRLLRVVGDLVVQSQAELGTEKPVVIAWQPGVGSACSNPSTSCFTTSDDVIHITGLSDHEWLPTVAAHELGHQLAFELGVAFAAGPHGGFAPVAATLAWSEGVATFLGQLFLGEDTLSAGISWQLDCAVAGGADPAEPLEQPLHEISVASVLWCLALDDRAAVLGQLRDGIRDRSDEHGAVGLDLVDFVDAWGCAGRSPRAAALAIELGLPYTPPSSCP